MKTLLRILCSLVFGSAAFAQPNAIKVQQLNSAGTSWQDRIFPPASGTSFNTLPQWRTAQGLGATDAVQFGTIKAAGNPQLTPVTTISALEAIPVTALTTNTSVNVLGYYAANDGGGGSFTFTTSSSATVDHGMVCSTPSGGTTRWIRNYSTPVNVRWLGAKGNWNGTTGADDTAAIQATINYVGTIGDVFIPTGAYKITTSLAPPASSTTGRASPLRIFGEGISTQLVNLCPASNPTFVFKNCSYFTLSDMLITGNSTNPNDGVLVDKTAGGQYTTFWKIERVTCCMAGKAFVLKDTNTGVIRDCQSWPSSLTLGFTVAPVVTLTDVSHGIYCTGGFCNNISIYDFICTISSSNASTACSIRCDATLANGINIIGGEMEGITQSSNQYSINLDNLYPFVIQGVFAENSKMRFSKCYFGTLTGIDKAGDGGTLFTDSCRNITVVSQIDDSVQIDSGTSSITIINSNFDAASAQITNNGSETTFLNVQVQGARVADIGHMPVAASVYLDTPQSITNSTQTVAIPNRTDYDPSSIYNVSNGRFTVPQAGKYRITMFGYIDLCTLATQGRATIYKNGSTTGKQQFSYCAKAGDLLPLSITFTVDCSAGDYLQIVVFQNDSTSRSLIECNICVEAI